jgi:hypothetical protein
MSWLDRFKPHKGDVYKPGQALPEPAGETVTGRRLYTVSQMRADFKAGSNESQGLLVRARNLLSHPGHWHATPEHAEKRRALSDEIAAHLNGEATHQKAQP